MRPRSGTSRACCRPPRTRVTPLTRQLILADEPDPAHRRRGARASRSARAVARHPVRRALPHGGRLHRVGDPDRPARRGDDSCSERDDRACRPGRDREAPALGGDARIHVGHQLGQDRDADAEPDDGGRDGDRRPPLRDHGRGILDRRARSPASTASRTCPSTPCCCRWRSVPTRRSATARWSATRRRARSSCSRRRVASTRR